jgi:hypothetical protein
MTTGVLTRPQRTTPRRIRSRYPGRLVLPLVIGAAGLLGWIVTLAVRLPERYVAGHWNVAWVGFDVILLASLVATAWAAARRPHLAPAAALVTAVLLLCDAWFDVTTASGSVDVAVSVASALTVELPAAGILLWAARRQQRQGADGGQTPGR